MDAHDKRAIEIFGVFQKRGRTLHVLNHPLTSTIWLKDVAQVHGNSEKNQKVHGKSEKNQEVRGKSEKNHDVENNKTVEHDGNPKKSNYLYDLAYGLFQAAVLGAATFLSIESSPESTEDKDIEAFLSNHTGGPFVVF